MDGFLDCSELGYDAVCPEEPECWGSLQNFGDVPVVATPIDCTEPHPFQTFVAVQLDSPPRTQSDLEKTPAIRALCTRDVLNQRLSTGRAGAQWQIQPIPYKVFPTPDNLSRCLVSTGVERTSPLPMKAPGLRTPEPRPVSVDRDSTRARRAARASKLSKAYAWSSSNPPASQTAAMAG